jgi:MYXO-CTERM domain-containing protein
MRLTNLRLGVFAVLIAAALAVPASAAPILTGNATIAFTGDFGGGPGSVSLSDLVPVAAGPEIQFGDASNIGTGVLLDSEALDLDGLTITYRIRGGGAPIPGQPGYLDNGMIGGAFTFSSLVFSPSTVIIGIRVGFVDVIDPQAAAATFSFTANSLTMANLQQFGIAQTADNTGLISVELITGDAPPQAPEPGSLVLLGVGVLAAARRITRKR